MKSAAMLTRSQGIILEQWQELLRLRKSVLKTSDLDAIHDLRVASRRFRAALELFEPWIAPKRTAPLTKNIKKLTRVLGELRNIDEALLFFPPRIPAESAGGYQLRYLLTQMRRGELAHIEEVLKAFDHRRLNRIVRKAVSGLAERYSATSGSVSLPDYFADTCGRRFQHIHDLLPAAPHPENREPRHALRIAIKKWRYFFEITAQALKSDCSGILGQLKEYQTILGSMNDVAEFGILCSDLALSRREHRFIEATLQAEDELLLQKLTELIRLKPLAYTFPP